VRNTANDNALAGHAKQNGIDQLNANQSQSQSPTAQYGGLGKYPKSPYQVSASQGNPAGISGQRPQIPEEVLGEAGEAGPEGLEAPSALEDASTSLLTAGAMSDEAVKVAQLAKSQGGMGNALKAISAGKGNLAGANAAGAVPLMNRAVIGLGAAQGLHGASKEIFGKGFGDLFGDEDPESFSGIANSAFGGNDPTSEGRRANAYGNMQNRFMTKMGLSDQWKQRLSSMAKPLNRGLGALDAFADPLTGGGLDVVRGNLYSMFGDDKFAKESGYDMDPYGAGRLMSRAMKTTPSWQKTKYNGQQP
jgi:hypothetical protein